MKGSEFAFHYFHLLFYKCHNINLKCVESDIDSPGCIKNKRATISPINKKNKCFQYEMIVALNHERIKKDPQRIAKIKLFINKCYWEKINIPSEKDDWKKLQKYNQTNALNVLYDKK